MLPVSRLLWGQSPHPASGSQGLEFARREQYSVNAGAPGGLCGGCVCVFVVSYRCCVGVPLLPFSCGTKNADILMKIWPVCYFCSVLSVRKH